jgi:hypothetical protein
MNARLHPVLALVMAFVAVPMLAQQGNPPAGQPVTAVKAASPAATASSLSDETEQAHVVGTIVTLTADRLELKVEKAIEPNSESAAGLVGQTVAFAVDATTAKPADLKANDRVDLWFTESNGQKHAVRIEVAAPASESSSGAGELQGSSPSQSTGTKATGATAASAPSEQAKPVEVEGTIVTLTADRLELKVEKAIEPNSEPAAGLVGQTVAFAVDAATEKPADLKANDRVDLWFTEKEGQKLAVRIVIAPAEGASSNSNGSGTPQAASVPPNPNPPPGGQVAPAQPGPVTPAAPAAPATLPGPALKASAPVVSAHSEATVSAARKHTAHVTHKAKAAAAVAKQPTESAALPNPPAVAEQPAGLPASPNAGAAVTGVAPGAAASALNAAAPAPAGSVDTSATAGEPQAEGSSHSNAPVQVDDPLRFVVLGAAAGLAALVMLFFTLRARHVDLGIGSGGGGMG